MLGDQNRISANAQIEDLVDEARKDENSLALGVEYPGITKIQLLSLDISHDHMGPAESYRRIGI